MADKKKISIVLFSGDFDKAVAAFTIASGAAAVNYKVNLFFTFWGLNVIKKYKSRNAIGKGMLARTFNFLMGGFKNLPLSRLNFIGASPKLMTNLMKKRNVATLEELINASILLKVNFFACEMSINILGLKKEDFIPEIKEVLGVAKFLSLAENGKVLFI
ncbi:MAG: DsrE/DsrF/DrsH-like family protein [Bacteroidetes bacterium]|nr:DsrE/DsrF/DrsH-like family protein [Bacteroidota bacterium]